MPCQGLKGRNNDTRKVGMRLETVRMHTFKCTYKGRKEFWRRMCTTICQGSKAETPYAKPGQGHAGRDPSELNPYEFTAHARVQLRCQVLIGRD